MGKLTLTPEVQERIRSLVNGGAPIPLACQAAGISYKTVEKWLARGREGEEPFATFVAVLMQAKAAHAAAATLCITKAGERDWKAAAYLLERRCPKHFHPPTMARASASGAATAERAVLYYPVPMPPGADFSDAPIPQHPLDETTTSVAYEDLE